MNYLAHAITNLEVPYWVAGTCTPDWLSVADRKVRTRSRDAQPLLEDSDPRNQQIAAGIIQHHEDDRWFHSTLAFTELNLEFAVELRDELEEDAGFRPSFLGHILVELLLDAELIRSDRKLVQRFYQSLQEVDPQIVQAVVNRVSKRPTTRLQHLIPLFIREAFLYDYVENARLLFRLNQVMHRVGLPVIPQTILSWLESARIRVRSRSTELLSGPA